MIPSSMARTMLVLICVAILAACGIAAPLSISAEEFAIESFPVPDNWEEKHRGEITWADKDIAQSWGQTWKPTGSNIWPGFSFKVYQFESLALARRGYRRSLQGFYEKGFNMEPLPEWAYVSDTADQYAMYCSSPETTGEYCYSVARYVNFVVVIALDPGEGVTLEDAPELLGVVDRHVQDVIETASDG